MESWVDLKTKDCVQAAWVETPAPAVSLTNPVIDGRAQPLSASVSSSINSGESEECGRADKMGSYIQSWWHSALHMGTAWYVLGPQLSWSCCIFWALITFQCSLPQERVYLSLFHRLPSLHPSLSLFSALFFFIVHITTNIYVFVSLLFAHPPPWSSYCDSYKWGQRSTFSPPATEM